MLNRHRPRGGLTHSRARPRVETRTLPAPKKNLPLFAHPSPDQVLGLSSTIGISSCAMADRQGERERRPLSYLAFDPDPTPVQFDEFARQGQAEPRALDLLVCRAH